MAHIPQKTYQMNYFYTQNMQQLSELNRPKNKCISFGSEQGKIGQKQVLSIEKRGGRPFASSSNGGFKNFMDNNALLDLGYVGNMFTWSNRRTGSMNIAERLDHGIANNQWKMIYPNAVITHLIASHSYHKPILFHLDSPMQSLPRPFKFETMWTSHPDTGLII